MLQADIHDLHRELRRNRGRNIVNDHQARQVDKDPGLHAKTPFVQSVITFDKRLLNIELPGDQITLGDQRRLVVDSFTLFRIVLDPLLYYQSVGPTQDGIIGR